ncbi:uncharacterized protein PAC_06248 [Phialocephala subalpina]|uniref:PH domain-containing protein n=1 Tax=Phialocephala subalpina TaxID=576137 RepID=A0A1L7WUD4_9HELO|nr:uncharacterized protein PAC_06248 [Phialocephala subalpina]
MTTPTPTTATTAQKFSRYRSVRHAPPPPDPPAPLPSTAEKKDDFSRTKSMSRYRRSKISFQVPSSEPLPPPIPDVPPPSYTRNASSGRTGTGSSPHYSPRGSAGQAEIQALMQGQRKRSGLETENERLRRKVREFQEREQARELAAEQALKEERERGFLAQQREAKALAEKQHRERELAKKKSQQEELVKRQILEQEQERMKEVEAARVLKENKRKDLERLQRELELASPPLLTKSPKREKFAFFSRKGSGSVNSPPQSATTSAAASASPASSAKPSKEVPRQHVQGPLPSQAPKRIMEASRPIERAVSSQAPKAVLSQAPKKAVEVPQQIQQGGGGIVPQTDAPISASNAGERRVLVRCKQSSVNLPVTPETTPKEIIYSAANFMTQNIIPSTAILIESYTQLGLTRRVRRYEHVRDVMNSWDRDTQNAFLLENSDTPRFDTDLELSGVPKEKPADVTVHMYHSQKPGTWIKRYITILSSGQVFIHKKSDAKLGDKNTIAICHLSDFDIYSPTPQQLRKVLKPPKKHCYAVKSQQKTAVFLSTENFVHFFSTDDESTSLAFYSAVQTWRSWYLVNKMGSGKKAKPASSVPSKNNFGSALLPSTSDDAEPYMIGTFSSLGLDDRDFKSGSSSSEFDTEDEERPRQVPFHLRNSILLSNAEAKAVMREAKRHPPVVNYRIPSPSEEEFATSGLLGRTYTTRQQKMAKENNNPQPAGPFTEGSNLLNRDAGRTMSMKSQSNGNSGLARSSSRAKPKPLLDFTPQFKEAPQWDKTGKGRGVAPIAGVPLVEVATTPDNPLQDSLPKATVFRRETTGARPGTSARPRTRTGEGAGEGGLVNGATNGNGVDGKSVMGRGRVRYD